MGTAERRSAREAAHACGIGIAGDGREIGSRRVLLLSGVAARTVEHRDGRTAAAELFGAPTLIEPDSAATRTISLGRSTFRPLFCTGPSSLTHSLASEQAALRLAWIGIIFFEPVRARIAYLLLLLSSSYPDEPIIPLGLSYSRIANLCGVTERSVDRCVAGWVRAGILERVCDAYRVRDDVALRSSLGDGAEIDFTASQARRARMLGAERSLGT